MAFDAPDGLIAPLLTPFNDDLSVATDLYIAHALDLLDQGCAAVAPFGTTGEALSIGIDERIAGLDALLGAGVPPDRLLLGTGLTNIPDTLRLTEHAVRCSCLAVLMLPPFYFKGPSDDGLFRYFDELTSRVDADDLSLLLYHFPRMAGVGFSIELVRRLRLSFPEHVVGIKDSSGDWANTRQLFDVDGLVVFPGSELKLLDALELGATGCITATANVNARRIVEVISTYRSGGIEAAASAQERAIERRLTIQDYEPISAQKYLLAARTGDARWAKVRPPLVSLSPEVGRALESSLESMG